MALTIHVLRHVLTQNRTAQSLQDIGSRRMALITGNTSLDPTNETLAMISPITTAHPTTDQDSTTRSRQAPRRTTVSRTTRDESNTNKIG